MSGGPPADAPILSHSLDDLLASGNGSASPLGTLCTLMKSSRQPMFVLWGGQRQLFYIEAYGVLLGERHPGAFGQPMLQVCG